MTDTSNTEYVSLKSLAAEFGLDRSSLRKYVIKSGLKPHKRRTPDSASQLTLAITPGEAEFIRERRRSEGFENDKIAVAGDIGVFYIIQLVPELDPKRVKLGFASDLVGSRLSQHKTSAPTATVVTSWPCRRSWEHTVRDAITASECLKVTDEVFECETLERLITIGDQLFSILPAPESSPGLSLHSPLNT